MSDKIKSQHLLRKAILYVRQSSPYQVTNNIESQRLQYAMEKHLRSLGWNEVEIIDEDLGRSAGGGVTRTGFERMVAQVCMGEVGAVCAREVSRFARNSREWQQLVEVCRIVDTLLVDQETVYSPRLGNDRLLLGLKGTLNEYELDLLRQRAGGGLLPYGQDCGHRQGRGGQEGHRERPAQEGRAAGGDPGQNRQQAPCAGRRQRGRQDPNQGPWTGGGGVQGPRRHADRESDQQHQRQQHGVGIDRPFRQ